MGSLAAVWVTADLELLVYFPPTKLTVCRNQDVAASVRMTLPVEGQSRTLRILLMHPEQSLARRLASTQPQVYIVNQTRQHDARSDMLAP